MPKKPAQKPYKMRRRKPTGKWQKIIIAMPEGASKHFPRRLPVARYQAFYRSAKDMGRNPIMSADGKGGMTIILDNGGAK